MEPKSLAPCTLLWPHVVAGKKEKVRDCAGCIGAAAVLGDAHGEEDAYTIGGRYFVGDRDQYGRSDAGNLFGVFKRIGFERFLVLVELIDPLLNELPVVQVIVEDVLCDAIEPDDVRGRIGADKDVGALGHLVFTKIGDDESLATKFVRPLHACRENRVVFSRVCPDDENEAGLLDICNGAGVATIADGALKSHRRWVLTVAGAVIDIVGADHGARELLHEVTFFVGAL
jgi:hypothetical protein